MHSEMIARQTEITYAAVFSCNCTVEFLKKCSFETPITETLQTVQPVSLKTFVVV